MKKKCKISGMAEKGLGQDEKFTGAGHIVFVNMIIM